MPYRALRSRRLRSLGRALVLLALWAGLMAAATVGAHRLDERYRAMRFVLSDTMRQCPVALAGNFVVVNCAATGPSR